MWQRVKPFEFQSDVFMNYQKMEKKPNPPTKLLRPKLKEASKKALQQKKQTRQTRDEPLRDILRSKQQLNREFILKNSLFWTTSKSSSLDKVRSLILRDLDLYTFQSTESFSLHQLSTIQLLSLSHNHICSLHPLSTLDSLLSLNLNNNCIYDLTPLSPLQNLTSLYLSNNKISNLNGLLPLLQLEVLHVYNNLIPYAEKEQTMVVAARLTELDIERNEVWRQGERESWCFTRMRKLNGENVGRREGMASTKGFGVTAGSWRNASAIIRPATAQPLEPVSENNENYMDIQNKLQQAQQEYYKVDNKYEDEIARNFKLKSQLHSKLAARKDQQMKKEDNAQKRLKCEQLRKEIAQIKAEVFEGANPLLRELFEVTMQAERSKLESESKRKMNFITPKKAQTQLPTEKPFDADEEIVFDDEEDPMERKPGQDDDAYIDRILNSNSDTLDQLRKQLQDLNQ